jgi:hypothetical protein
MCSHNKMLINIRRTGRALKEESEEVEFQVRVQDRK